MAPASTGSRELEGIARTHGEAALRRTTVPCGSSEAGAGPSRGPRAGHTRPVTRAPGACGSSAESVAWGSRPQPMGENEAAGDPEQGPGAGAGGGAGAQRPGDQVPRCPHHRSLPPPPLAGCGMVKFIPPWPQASSLRVAGSHFPELMVWRSVARKGWGRTGAGTHWGQSFPGENLLGVQVTQGSADLF